MNKVLLLPLLLVLACSSPEPTSAQAEKTVVGYGPEDMVIDTRNGENSLLISCASRRPEYPEFGEIRRFHPGTGTSKTLVRSGEPVILRFHPHGIFLDTLSSPERLLVISHENEETGFHPVLIYTVTEDTLFFSEMIESPLLVSPNSLVTGPSGEIFVVNDAAKRGSIMAMALKLRKATIVRFKKYEEGGYSGEIVAGKLGMPAGVNRIGDKLFVSDATLNRVFSFEITSNELINRQELLEVKGPDNIRVNGSRLLVACHTKPMAFVRHAKKASVPSPCEIVSLDPETGNENILFYDDGRNISTGSVAVALDGNLWIGQVFEDWIVSIPLNE